MTGVITPVLCGKVLVGLVGVVCFNASTKGASPKDCHNAIASD